MNGQAGLVRDGSRQRPLERAIVSCRAISTYEANYFRG